MSFHRENTDHNVRTVHFFFPHHMHSFSSGPRQGGWAALVGFDEELKLGCSCLWVDGCCVVCISMVAAVHTSVTFGGGKGVGSPSPNVVGSHNGNNTC